MDYSSQVRRTDLNLRAKHPELATTIYKIENNKFLIFFEKSNSEFEKVRNEFENSIKPITLPVNLTDKEPSNFVEIISNISDAEISKGFEGMSLSRIDLMNLLLSKFPKVHFLKISDAKGVVNIYTASFKEKIGKSTFHRFLSVGDRKKVTSFLKGLKLPLDFNLIEQEFKSKPDLNFNEHELVNPSQFIYAASLKRDNSLEFSLRDEALWYDNIDNIFQGKFKKQDLFFYDSDEYSCYVDFSIFPNIDIRNHLFLFQTIYISPPFDKSIIGWLKESKITKNEFLDLVSTGRIKVLLVQPESRYDINFIRDIYSANPLSVITRRAIATLQQIDITDICDNYLLNDTNCINELGDFCQSISKQFKIKPNFLFDMLAWPIKARRASFEVLNYKGGFGMSAIGVNKAIEKGLSEFVGKDLTFDFTVNTPTIHLANSLNAIYFPYRTNEGYSDVQYASIMGELLNFYKSANMKNIKSFLENKHDINSGVMPINPIDVIEVNDYISISELEEIVSKDVVFPKNKRLIKTLSELSIEGRKEKIDIYNTEVNKRIERKKKRKNVIDLGTSILLDTSSVLSGTTVLGTAFSIFNITSKKALKSIPLFKNILLRIEEALNEDTDKANIDYLTKINRVAKVKSTTLS